MEKSWWQMINDWIPTVQDVENKRQGVVDWAGGDGSLGGAIAEGVTLPIKGVVDTTSTLGNVIGGAAGAIGGSLSEAGQEAAQRDNNSAWLDAVLSGARGGAEEGGQAARENINVLDIASLGTGALGSSALRAAKLASTAGNLEKAGSLVKGAGQLAKLDTGLSAVDAGIGATQVASGIKEGDWSEGLMGLARVAGNVYGMRNSMKDLGEGRALRSIIDELGIKDTAADSIGPPIKKASGSTISREMRLPDVSGRDFDLSFEKTGNPEIDSATITKIKMLKDDPEKLHGLSMLASTIREISEEAKITNRA